MKQFAFPLSIKCASVKERNECVKLLESIGYKTEDIDDLLYVTNVYGKIGTCSTIADNAIYLDDSYHIDHFNPALIRDIASACTNDTWQEGEPWKNYEIFDSSRIKGFAGNVVAYDDSITRPTLAEICEHHGYEIKGRDIVRKEEKISNCDKSYCETAMRLDEATAEINRLKSENAELKEKLKAVAGVDNQELERLRGENAELKQKLNPFTQLGVVCEQISEVIKAIRDIDIIKLKHENNELLRKLVDNNQCLNLLQNEITGLEIRNKELQIKLREITSVINK